MFFFGYVVSKNGIFIDFLKFELIKNWLVFKLLKIFEVFYGYVYIIESLF